MDKKKNVFWLGIVSFFTDVSSEMIFPILPLFLTTVLNANMAIVGLIEGIAESASSILQLFSGWFSDKIGKRKPIVFWGYTLSAATKPILAIATSWWHVLAVRVADRVGKGIRTAPRDAMIASSTNKNERGKYFGLHRMLDTLGAIAGTLISLAILSLVSQDPSVFRKIFLLSAIPGLIAVIIIITKVKEVNVKREIQPAKSFKPGFRGLGSNYKKFILITALFGFANLSYAFFILRAKDAGVAVALIPAVYLVYNICYAAFSVPAGKISDAVGRKNTLVAGYILFGISSLGFAFWANSRSMWLLFALYGIFIAVTDGVSRAFVSDMVREEKRGLALGTYHFAVGVADLPANIAGGLLWSFVGVQAPFIAASAFSLLAAFLLITLIKEKRK